MQRKKGGFESGAGADPSPFRDLRALLGLPDSPGIPPGANGSDSDASDSAIETHPPNVRPQERKPGPARAVVRKERRGQAGKEVTVISKLEIGPQHREKWLREMKAAFGCGGFVDGPNLVLQGDLRPRAHAWLLSNGVRKVTVG